MPFSLLDFSNPRVKILWCIFLAVAFLTYLASRGVSWKSREQQIRNAVETATGIGAKGGFSKRQILQMTLSFAFLGGAFGLMFSHFSDRRRIGGGQLVQIELLAMCAFLVPAITGYIMKSGLRKIERSFRAGDYQLALQENERLLRWFGDSSYVHFFRAQTLLFSGRVPEAEEAFRIGLEKGQRAGSSLQAAGLYGLGRALLEQGKFTTATTVLDASAKIYPWFGAWEGLAEILVRQKEPTRALQLLDKAIEQGDPRTKRHRGGSLRAIRAQALAMLGRIDEAASDLQKAIEGTNQHSVPDLAENYWRSGVALLAMHREADAIKQFEQAKGIDPTGLYGTRSAQNSASARFEHSRLS
jgi:tetratricopeptide (TPR) repeat protein